MKSPTAAYLTGVVAFAIGLTEVNAQTADVAEKYTDLETITTIGTRTERPIDQIDASVSVKTSEQIEQELARDLEDLVRFEPGVTTGGTGSRFGIDGISIRGIGGNRVLTTLDGVRMPEEFSFGPFLSARRDYLDIDSLARADIARGPTSPLYGSDALGGVVAFTSKQPLDYLDTGNTHAGLKTGFDSADESKVATVTLAGGNKTLSSLLVYTHRDAEETENTGRLGGNGPQRELPDPQDIQSDSVAFHAVYQPSDLHQFSLKADYYTNETESQILSDYDTVTFGVLTTRRDAEDERNRAGIAFGYAHYGKTLLSDQLEAKLYHQNSDSSQFTNEDRLSGGAAQYRTRLSAFEQEITGAQLNLNKAFGVGASENLLSYGIDYYQTDNISERNGQTTDVITGDIIFSPFSNFPTRDFPITEVTQAAAYLQNEMEFLDGKLRVTPGLRYDRFSANVEPDDVYLNGNPGTTLPEDYDDSELTKKLGLFYEINSRASMYARYSEGFRAPPYDDVNVGFTNFLGGYQTIANPDLESETSQGNELGFRFSNDSGYLSIAAFKNDYDNFIALTALPPEDGDTLVTYQSVNIDSVEINGLELSGGIDLETLASSLNGFNLKAAIAYAKGKDKQTDEPLNSVEPLSGVFGLSYASAGNRWGANLYLTLVDNKDTNDIDLSEGRHPTAGYGLVDLMAHFQITEKVRIDAGVFNLTDKSYVRWADTAGIGSEDAIDRFTQPGINSRVTLRIDI